MRASAFRSRGVDRRSSVSAVLVAMAPLFVACGGSDGPSGDPFGSGSGASSSATSGGASNGAGANAGAASGGSTSGRGGTPANGGVTAGGGASASPGGSTGNGGVPGGSGGAPVNGGASASGGAAASGGSTPAGGGATSGSGGASPVAGNPRLFYLDILGGRVLSAKPDGSDVRVLVRGASGLPDGVAVDVAGKALFWTNMGNPSGNDGFIDRTDLDGKGMTTPVAAGKTFTPKQLKLEAASGKLYWADREGMRIMRANADGSGLETLVETGSGDTARRDASNWCVGIALDAPGKKIYWTQKGGDNAGTGSIRRAGLELPAGEDAAHRSDIEVLFEKLPEPIDLDVDLTERQIYWTDRGNPPKGNTVSRAPMDPPGAAATRTDQKILVTGLAEGIGISLDLAHRVMYFGDLGGTIYSAGLDGTNKRTILTGQGNVTGIAYVELPP